MEYDKNKNNISGSYTPLITRKIILPKVQLSNGLHAREIIFMVNGGAHRILPGPAQSDIHGLTAMIAGRR